MPWPIPDIPLIAPPKRLRSWRWAAACVGAILLGITCTVLFWPKGTATGTPWFWTCAAVFPLTLWGLVFSLRLHRFELAKLEAANWNAHRDQALRRWAQWSQRGLAIADAAVSLPAGLVVEDLAGMHDKPQPATTPLMQWRDAENTAALHDALESLLERMPALLQTPAPFAVHLQASTEAFAICRDALHTALNQLGLQYQPATALKPADFCEQINTWLDASEPMPWRLVVACDIAPQDLNDDPTCSETLSALLFAPDEDAHEALAHWQRPMPTMGDQFATDLPHLLAANGVPADTVARAWLAGVPRDWQGTLISAADDAGCTRLLQNQTQSIHVADQAVGPVGPASCWLGLALAALAMRYVCAPQIALGQQDDQAILNLLLPG